METITSAEGFDIPAEVRAEVEREALKHAAPSRVALPEQSAPDTAPEFQDGGAAAPSPTATERVLDAGGALVERPITPPKGAPVVADDECELPSDLAGTFALMESLRLQIEGATAEDRATDRAKFKTLEAQLSRVKRQCAVMQQGLPTVERNADTLLPTGRETGAVARLTARVLAGE